MCQTLYLGFISITLFTFHHSLQDRCLIIPILKIRWLKITELVSGRTRFETHVLSDFQQVHILQTTGFGQNTGSNPLSGEFRSWLEYYTLGVTSPNSHTSSPPWQHSDYWGIHFCIFTDELKLACWFWRSKTGENFMNIIEIHMKWERLNCLKSGAFWTYAKNSWGWAIPATQLHMVISAANDLIFHLIWQPLWWK